MPQQLMQKKLKLTGSMEDLQDLLEITPKTDVLFITGNWNAKVGSQEIPGVKKSLALEYKMKQDKSKQSFCKRMHWS